MKLATYSTSDDATPRVGLVRDKELVPLADNGIKGDMTSLLEAGIDINVIETVTKGKAGVTSILRNVACTRTDARENTCPRP